MLAAPGLRRDLRLRGKGTVYLQVAVAPIPRPHGKWPLLMWRRQRGRHPRCPGRQRSLPTPPRRPRPWRPGSPSPAASTGACLTSAPKLANSAAATEGGSQEARPHRRRVEGVRRPALASAMLDLTRLAAELTQMRTGRGPHREKLRDWLNARRPRVTAPAQRRGASANASSTSSADARQPAGSCPPDRSRQREPPRSGRARRRDRRGDPAADAVKAAGPGSLSPAVNKQFFSAIVP